MKTVSEEEPMGINTLRIKNFNQASNIRAGKGNASVQRMLEGKANSNGSLTNVHLNF